MARARNLSVKDCNKSIEGINKIWFEDFQVHTDNITYHNNIERLLKLKIFSDRPFNTYDMDDIFNFCELLESLPVSPSTINNYLSAIVTFKDYLINKFPNDFNKLFLSEVGDLRQKGLKQFERIPLNPYQLNLIRKYTDTKPITKYIFEIFFQLGIDKKDIEFCNIQNINYEKMEFKTNKDPIKYNVVIQNILLKYSGVISKVPLTTDKASSRFETITGYLIKNNANGKYSKKRLLCYEDIKMSHDLFIFTCPNCKVKHENLASNWVLAKTEFEEEYRLVCSLCKGIQK